ncbi:MAG: DUF4214 domain-containing protein, partial [Neptuniibacter sp.]
MSYYTSAGDLDFDTEVVIDLSNVMTTTYESVYENFTPSYLGLTINGLDSSEGGQIKAVLTMPDTPFSYLEPANDDAYSSYVVLNLAFDTDDDQVVDLQATISFLEAYRQRVDNGFVEFLPAEERIDFSLYDFTGHGGYGKEINGYYSDYKSGIPVALVDIEANSSWSFDFDMKETIGLGEHYYASESAPDGFQSAYDRGVEEFRALVPKLEGLSYDDLIEINLSITLGWIDSGTDAYQSSGFALQYQPTQSDLLYAVDNASPTGSVTISGIPQQGQTLTASNTLEDADGVASSITYQWEIEGVTINGATTDQLLLTQDHVGKSIAVIAGYTDGLGNTESSTSNSTIQVTSNESGDEETGDLVTTYPATSAPDDFIGTAGVDLVSYTDNSSGFSIINNDGVITVTEMASPSNTDTLTNIERLQFSDTNIALDIDGANSAGGIYRTYQAAFDRTPDTGGFGYWIDRADEGASAVQMAEEFVWSAEFQSVYGVTTTDNYLSGNDIESVVDGFYRNVLGRDPDQGGLDFYSGVIEAEERTVGRVLAEIA